MTSFPVRARRGRLATRGGALALLVATLTTVGAPAASAGLAPVGALTDEHLAAMAARLLPETAPTVFAAVDGVSLLLPGDVRAVGFHESGSASALPLAPIGRLDANDNAARITLPAVRGERDGGYVVLPTRRRPAGPTTAVDLSMSTGEPVASPVTGTVAVAEYYRLYGRTHDGLVEIVPDGRPDLRVRVLHVEDLRVQAGQRVRAGETHLAAGARLLPFPSQIDRHAGRHPHAHVEVVRR